MIDAVTLGIAFNVLLLAVAAISLIINPGHLTGQLQQGYSALIILFLVVCSESLCLLQTLMYPFIIVHQGASCLSRPDGCLIYVFYLAILGANWLYHALMESSARQATPGKMLMKIQVTDLNGQRISFWRATARHFSKMLSTLLLLVGFMMTGWTKKNQALHDRMAGCLVVMAGSAFPPAD